MAKKSVAKKGLYIVPLNCGTIHIEKSTQVYWQGFGQKIDIPSMIFLILGGEKKILVDTSFLSLKRAKEAFHWPASRTPEQELPHQFKKAGVDPKEIELVIFTHLHWDHAQNNRLFPNAKFMVSRTELRYAIAPLSTQAIPYEAPVAPANTYPVWVTDRTLFEAVDLDRPKKIIEGVTYFSTPGHTIGGASIAVETKGGTYVIAGDAINLYENIEKMIPGGQMYTQEDAVKSIERILEVASSPMHVLPGHEVKVLDKDRYP
jgi:N-acyl homoserine lactone hydrolase